MIYELTTVSELKTKAILIYVSRFMNETIQILLTPSRIYLLIDRCNAQWFMAHGSRLLASGPRRMAHGSRPIADDP